ncbi:MAG: hypothetical protein M3Z07_01495 [Candidatus Eremiobacteraeota bacterium]|nr:hypothetical protein [Candidatus Eremiobacteraeota bacterium]
MTLRLSAVVFFLLAVAAGPVASFADEPKPSPVPIAPHPSPSPSTTPSPKPTDTPGPAFGNMQWREIGPALPGGRVAGVAGSATDANLYYLGSAGGGIWKSADSGETWHAVFEKQKVSAIGAIAIDPTNNEVVWAGTGESNPRNDVTYGDGIYKTADGGKTWKNVGLGGTRHISRILIDPKNPNHVIVGALGDVFGDSTDRGVYVTDDGGTTWSKTLYLGPMSGASDLAMDTQNPNVVYAGMWQFRRQPWTTQSGGPDDGLYRSSDGGRTWTKLTGHGLPSGITGRIGLAVAPSDGNRVYALIESSEGILWRSDDGGANWTMTSNDTIVDQRPFYFSHIAVDSKDPNKVYAVSFELALSRDGGKTFKAIAQDVHVDYHAIWIAPNDPKRIIVGEDGGIARTVDGGQHWFFDRNIPIGQVYHVGVSVHENPYTICGGWQDNNAWCGPSNSLDPSGILNKHWVAPTGGDGMWVVPDPSDPNWIWGDSQGGNLQVYNRVTKDTINAIPYLQNSIEGYDLRQSKYRFNWDSPVTFAPWNPHIAWLGGNVVFQTMDRGRHWTVISPDLTLNDKTHQIPAGGPITHDVSGAEFSDNLLDIEGSTLRRGEIWVGTDDGLVQLTRDSGKHWRNVTPPGVAPYGRVETVAPSTTADGTAFANIDRHRSGDFKPYLFVTHDFGTTWTAITTGLPADQYVRSVRPDLHNGSIVYAGTENGMWISLDGGSTWQDFKNNLPTVSVRDIRFQPEFNDMVIATHGRSLYVMDDMRPIQALTTPMARGDFMLAPRTAYEYTLHGDDEGNYNDYAGANPPSGAVIFFYQTAPGKTSPVVQILDSSGHVIRTIQGTHKVAGKDVPYVTNKVGINQYVWDFQIDGPVKWKGAFKEAYQGPNEGPSVPPGQYAVRMTLGGKTTTQKFKVMPDPRTKFTQAEFVQSYVLSKKYFKEFSVVDTMLNTLDDVKKQLDAANTDASKKSDTALTQQIADALKARATLFHELTADFHNGEDSIQRPGMLREDVQGMGYAGSGLITSAVTELGGRIDAQYRTSIAHFNTYLASLGTLNSALTQAGLKPISGQKPVEAGI